MRLPVVWPMTVEILTNHCIKPVGLHLDPVSYMEKAQDTASRCCVWCVFVETGKFISFLHFFRSQNAAGPSGRPQVYTTCLLCVGICTTGYCRIPKMSALSTAWWVFLGPSAWWPHQVKYGQLYPEGWPLSSTAFTEPLLRGRVMPGRYKMRGGKKWCITLKTYFLTCGLSLAP